MIYKLVVLALTCITVTGCGSPGTTAVPVNDFLSSVGVQTKLSQPGQDDYDKTVAALKYTGIRNVRERGADFGVKLHADTGVKVCKVAQSDLNQAILDFEKLAMAGALLAVEGPNEPNNFPITYNGRTSDKNSDFMPVAEFQRDLYARVKADPLLAGIPVFHSSEAGGSEPNNVGLQFLTIPAGAGQSPTNPNGTIMPEGTQYADYANCHNYLISPGHSPPVDNTAWGCMEPGYPDNRWDGMVDEYGVTWNKKFAGYNDVDLPKQPRVTTETGWFTTGPDAVSEDVQGKLFLNLYFSAFNRGWSYTFIYMLHDSATQKDWGLYHLDYSPKPAATFMHNLTTILADSGTNSSPGALNYAIANQPDTVHDLLMQKSNGQFELAVWSELVTGTNTVTVDLGKTSRRVNIYDPTVGVDPIEHYDNVSSITLTLSDHPVIVELSERNLGHAPTIPVKDPVIGIMH